MRLHNVRVSQLVLLWEGCIYIAAVTTKSIVVLHVIFVADLAQMRGLTVPEASTRASLVRNSHMEDSRPKSIRYYACGRTKADDLLHTFSTAQ